jgi:sulfatase maturation enzyme AslB (radical SAM superfamily)
VKLCCSINENIHATGKDGEELNFGTHNVEDIWNSDYMINVRKQMLNGERPKACEVCWKLEDSGIQSSRQSAFIELKDWAKPKDYQTSHPPLPQSLELRLGNFCNLRCNSCWSLSSDRVANERRKIQQTDDIMPYWLRKEWDYELDLDGKANWVWWENNEFIDSIKKLAPKLKRLYLTGGEPTLIKRNIEIMQMILDTGNTDCYIALTTNLTQWNEIFYNTMSRFKHGEIQISIDHVHDKNEYIRYPTKWENIEKNIIRMYDKFPQTWKIKHYTVFQTYNYDAIPKIVDWAHNHRSWYDDKEKNRLYIWSPIMLDNPSYLDVRIIQPEIREKCIDALKSYEPSHSVPNIWYQHGIQQAIKRLEDNSFSEEYCVEKRQQFREFNDTMDRHRKTKWYSTFLNIAQEVLNDG